MKIHDNETDAKNAIRLYRSLLESARARTGVDEQIQADFSPTVLLTAEYHDDVGEVREYSEPA